jgi:hypothetical protein
MIKAELIKKSIADFFSPKLLAYSVVPFLITFALFLYLYLGVGGEWIDSFKHSIENGTVPFLDADKHPILTYILTIGLFEWLFSIFFYLVGAIAVILLTVVVSATIVGFFTPAIVKVIRDKHYPDFVIKNDDFTIGTTVWYFVKVFSIFALLFLIALPLLFIPGVNFFAINIPFYYLFHNMLVLDVGSSILSKEEFKTITKKHKLLFRTTTLSEYGISLIPLMGMVFQVLFVIILAHQFFAKSMEARF